MEKNLRAEAGARTDTPIFLVLLTDGKSQDDAITAADRLKRAGVEIIAVGGKQQFDSFVESPESVRSVLLLSRGSGVKNADEAELRQMASEPVDLNVYNVNDFPLLSKLVSRLVHILCSRIEDRGVKKRTTHTCRAPSAWLGDSRRNIFILPFPVKEQSRGRRWTRLSCSPARQIYASLNLDPEK